MSIRNLKLSYILYNFFHKKKLKHNIPLYRKYGLHKQYYSSISSADFKHLDNAATRKEDISKIKESIFFQKQNNDNQESLLRYFDRGFSVVRGFISTEKADEVNHEIERLRQNGELNFTNGNKLMFAIHKSETIKDIGLDADLMHFLDILMDGKTKLFQSINFINGSQQKTHSDSIHMTTFPLGGLIGVWIALEDVDMENGALHYYPQSHRLPYYMNSDYDNEGNFWKLGEKGYAEYEKMLAEKVAELNLEKEIFTCKKGDMLIWHANILHGGEPHIDKTRTRKSMVFHYFDMDAICYHEVSQRPALFES